MYTVLLSGGSGKRLWPLSNDLCSKQYIQLVNHDGAQASQCSMLQRVWTQLKQVGLEVVIAASTGQKEIIQNQLGSEALVAIEPDRRDTFPAIMLSCAYLHSELGVPEDEYVAIQPVDPYTHRDFFAMLPQLAQRLHTSGAEIGLIGARPTYPSQKYGYIVPKECGKDDVIAVHHFCEKPDLTTAKELVAQGALWNCGVFCFRLGLANRYLAKYNLPLSYTEVFKNYAKLPKISFDYEVLEKATSLVAMPYFGMWKDLGTWNTLTEEMSESSMGKVICDEASSNVHAINMLDIPLVIMGGHNMVVAASHDGILVADKHQSSYLKDALKDLDAEPRYEERRWGTIKTLEMSGKGTEQTAIAKVKIFMGMNSSYHCHHEHDEIITILSGEGEIVLDGRHAKLSVGDSIKIPRNTKHSIRATSELRFLETRIGSLLKDDIHRDTFVWDEIEQSGGC